MKVKICGLTSVDAARACAQAGADFVGLNFHPGSVRFIDLERATEIAASLPRSCTPVGVFVDRAVDDVLSVAEHVGLRWVQLHGVEPTSHIGLLHARGLSVIKAFRLGTADDITRLSAALLNLETLGSLPEAILIDAAGPIGQPGGTGKQIPTQLLERLPAIGNGSGKACGAVWGLRSRLILAGGLTPENVAGRIQLLGRNTVWMVDTASGVETSPGVKDLARVQAFIAAARGA